MRILGIDPGLRVTGYGVIERAGSRLRYIASGTVRIPAQDGLPVHEYTALQVKQAVAGHGKAHKSAVQEMVRRLLGLDGTPGTDSADALAVAICHTNHTGVQAAAGGQLARMGLKLRGGRLVD